jgi:hypothetical protein
MADTTAGGPVNGFNILLRQLIQRFVAGGGEVPPEQIGQLSRNRYMCEKTCSLLVVVLFCVTLVTVGVIKIEHVQEMFFSGGNQSLLEKIFCNVRNMTKRLEQTARLLMMEEHRFGFESVFSNDDNSTVLP